MKINIRKSKNSFLVYSTSLFMLLLMAGCSSLQVGHDFDAQGFDNIAKIGETTKSQVLNKMGQPKNKGVSIDKHGERLVEWLYFYASGKLPAMDNAMLKILQIRFDKNGVIRSYNWTK